MTDDDVLTYLNLVHRRLIILTSGADWRLEYDDELRSIDDKLSSMRVLIDSEHAKWAT